MLTISVSAVQMNRTSSCRCHFVNSLYFEKIVLQKWCFLSLQEEEIGLKWLGLPNLYYLYPVLWDLLVRKTDFFLFFCIITFMYFSSGHKFILSK